MLVLQKQFDSEKPDGGALGTQVWRPGEPDEPASEQAIETRSPGLPDSLADLSLTWSWPSSSRSSSFSHLLVGGRLSSFVGVCCSKCAVRWRVVFSVAAIEAVATLLPARLWPVDGVQPQGAAGLPGRPSHLMLFSCTARPASRRPSQRLSIRDRMKARESR